MAIKLGKAMSAYDRVDTTDVDCGNGWICEIRSFPSVVKEFAKIQAKIRAKGGMKPKAKTQSASYAEINGLTLPVDDKDPWLLGSFEADVDFMVDHLLINWRGLKDDDGVDVPYTPDAAREVFLENRPASEQLYREFITVSLDNKNFVRTVNQQAEEDGKN